MALPKHTKLTEQEYHALEAASQIKHEFVNGEVYAMTGGSQAHNDISDNIYGLLFVALRGGRCRAHHSDMALKVEATGDTFYPDITIVCGERAFADDAPVATLLNPVTIIEVLSPSTELYDRTTKFDDYRQIPTLKDYVLVAQDQPRIDVYSRRDDDAWVLTPLDGLDAALYVPAVDVTLPLTDIYAQVDFDKDSPS